MSRSRVLLDRLILHPSAFCLLRCLSTKPSSFSRIPPRRELDFGADNDRPPQPANPPPAVPGPTRVMQMMRTAGDEPVPGYRLVEPLGKGGYGEVWKCSAP